MYKGFILLFYLISFSAVAQTFDEFDIEQHDYVEIDGIYRKAKDPKASKQEKLDSADVIIMDHHKHIISKVAIANDGKFDVFLPINGKYFIRIHRRGYISKIIEFNTHVPHTKKHHKPSEKYTPKKYDFKYEVALYQEIPGFHSKFLEHHPVAIIKYSPNEQSFVYDAAYASKVAFELDKFYEEYNKQHKIHKEMQDSIRMAKPPVQK